MSFTIMSSALGDALGKSALQPLASLGYCKLPWFRVRVRVGVGVGVRVWVWVWGWG